MNTVLRQYEAALGRALHNHEVFMGGIRSTLKNNTFDDLFVYGYRDPSSGYMVTEVKRFSTDPGAQSLTHPISPKGCAILKPGFYKDAYCFGNHKGYPALVQCKPVTVYRDNNRDLNFDFDTPTETGLFGINIHRASPTHTSLLVEDWSAGCQVFADPQDFGQFLSTLRAQQVSSGQEFYSYLLI